MDVFLTGFPKKLLVALSIVVIIAMCLMPTEARTLEHKKRHKRPENIANPTKDTAMRPAALEHRRRHHQSQKRLENLTQQKKSKRPKNPQTDIYNSETKKIITKLRNTRTFFLKEKRLFNQRDLREYKNTIPSWLPTVNFVEIHHHDFKSNRSRKNGTTIPERKYTYLMPKLYKSLVEYEEVFKRLINMELDFPDDPLTTYKKKRRRILRDTIDRLFSTIHEVNDSMTLFNMTASSFNKNKIDISSLPTKVDATECMKNDFLALRGYGNLLTNWFLEFKCSKGKQLNAKQQEMCKQHENKLNQRSSSRRKTKMLMFR